MANSYTQLFIHIVFATRFRERIIPPQHKEELHKYITGIIKNKGNLLLAINCVPDHMHILIALKPTTILSDLVRDIKCFSSAFINEQRWLTCRFAWQEGYGAFSCSADHCARVKAYIARQEEHHQDITFEEEYLNLLREYGVEYDMKYVL